jgi:hypothetical protein
METNVVFDVQNMFNEINRRKPLAFLALANGESATEADREALHDLTVVVEELYGVLVGADEPCEDDEAA